MSKKTEKRDDLVFYGRMITPQNRRYIYHELFNYFVNTESKKDEYSEYSNEEILQGAEYYAKFELGREQKHFKAWLKGKHTYTYKKRPYKVIGRDLNVFSGLQADITTQLDNLEKQEEE